MKTIFALVLAFVFLFAGPAAYAQTVSAPQNEQTLIALYTQLIQLLKQEIAALTLPATTATATTTQSSWLDEWNRRAPANSTPGFGGGGGHAASAPIADTPAPYVAQAVHFDGNTYLRNNSLVSIDSRYWSFSFWIKSHDLGPYEVIGVVDPAGAYASEFGTYSAGIFAAFNNGSLEPVDNISVSGSALIDTWYHVLGSVDSNSPQGSRIIKMYFNDVPVGSHFDVDDGVAIPAVLSNGLPFMIGDDTFGGSLTADIADIWLAPGVFLFDGGDIPTSTRRKFISADGKPVDLGSNCSSPTGAAPAICFPGDYNSFVINKGGGGAFTLTGTLANADTSPSN
jgi:hypothetical protein